MSEARARAIRALKQLGLASDFELNWLRAWGRPRAEARQRAKARLARLRSHGESRRLAERMARDRDPS